MRVRGRITLADLRATFGHLRQLARMRTTARRQRERERHRSLAQRIVGELISRGLPWLPAVLAFVLASRKLFADVSVVLVLAALLIAVPLTVFGATTRRVRDFDILRMPSRRALVATRWLMLLPIPLACGVAWWAGAWFGRPSDDPQWLGLLGSLFVAMLLTVSANEKAWEGIPRLLQALCFVLTHGIALLTAVGVILGPPSETAGWTVTAAWSFAAAVAVLGLACAGLLWSTLRLADRSVSTRHPVRAQSTPTRRRPSRRSPDAAPRPWPTTHRPARSRVQGDAALGRAQFRQYWLGVRNPLQAVLAAFGTALPFAWALGGGVLLVWLAEPGSDELPSPTALIGILLFSPLGVAPSQHRWLLGSDYATQIRARAVLLGLSAWLPRALGVGAALVAHAIRDGRVSDEALVTALLLLALGLLPLSAIARRAWRPWSRIPGWILGWSSLGIPVAVLAPILQGGIPLAIGLWTGATLACLSIGAALWILRGLPEEPLRHWHRKATE